MRMRVNAGVVACVLVGACVPSRAELFGPVHEAAAKRFGVEVEWRERVQPSAAAEARVAELLAKPLTAESAVAIALLNSAELQAEYEQLGVAGAQVARAHAPPNPAGEARMVLPASGDAHVELTLVESVTGLVTMLPRHHAADAQLRAARRHALVATVLAAARARVAFFGAVAATQRLELRARIAEAAATSAELALRLHTAGNLTDLDLAREQVFAEEAGLAERDAEAALVAARGRVDAALGLSGAQAAGWKTATRLAGAPDAPPALDRFVAEATDASLDLDELTWRLRAAGYDVQVARWHSFLPDLGLGVAANHDGAWGFGPAATISVPIFDWGQGERAAAWSSVRRLRQQHAALAVRVAAVARAARARLLAAHERATRLRTHVLPLREKILDEAVKQYNAMNLGPFELLVIRREHIEAELQYIDALADYWSAGADVDALRAGALPEGSR